MNWRRERDLFFIALAFLTRIPIPGNVSYITENFNSAARYFPLIGAIVGMLGATMFALALQLWSLPIAVVLSMASTVLITGAFHEDGFADSCDGFGGGWRREQVLAIMKDSRIGSYGTIGLILLIGTKFFSLTSLVDPVRIGAALIAAHAWSRLFAVSYLYDFDYARDDDTSKVKPMATQLSQRELLFAVASTAPLLALVELWRAALAFAVLMVWRWLFGRFIQRRIGGYTGDCLGCAQQVAEVLIYLVLGANIIT